MIRRTSLDQRLLAVVIIALAVLVVVVVALAGSLQWWMPLAVGALLAATLGRQDSYLDTLLLVAVVGCWIAGGHATHPVATLGVAVLVLALHAALSMRASAPLEAPFGRLVWTRWLGRLAVMTAVTAVAWGGTWGLQRAQLSGSGVAVVVALVACAGVGLLVRRLLLADED